MTRARILRLALCGAACVLLAWAGAPPARADAAAKNNEGNRLYDQKKYDEALKKYTDAQASRPEAPELHYNIGNVLFRKGEFDKAIEEYRRAQTVGSAGLAQQADFNRGNALMMKGQVPEAIQAYVQALRSDPHDQDAKRNLELALRLLQQQQKQQPQQQPPRDQKNPPQSSPPPPPTPQPSKPEEQKPQPKPGQMSEDEARQILQAIKEAEKDNLRKHAREAAASDKRPPEKDW